MLGVAIAAANSWGLLLVILFSGFGMVEVPRKVWRRSSHSTTLTYYQSQVVHMHEELVQAETDLDTVLKVGVRCLLGEACILRFNPLISWCTKCLLRFLRTILGENISRPSSRRYSSSFCQLF